MVGGYGGCIVNPGRVPRLQTSSRPYSAAEINGAKIVSGFIEEAWNGPNPQAAVGKHVTDDYLYNLGGDSKPIDGVRVNERIELGGPNDLVKLIEACRKEAPNLQVRVKQMIVSGDLVIVRLTTSGRMKKAFRLPTTAVYRVQGDKIAASWHLLDWQRLKSGS